MSYMSNLHLQLTELGLTDEQISQLSVEQALALVSEGK